MAALIGILEAPKRAATSRPVHVAVLLTFLAVFLLWLVFRPAFLDPESDFVALAPDYESQVRSLVAGEGFGSFRYPPVFPLMLAGLQRLSSSTGIDDGWLGATLLLVFAISGSILVLLLGQHLWGSRGGLFCVVVWLAYPILWRLWLQPLSAAPFVVALLAAVLLILHSGEEGRSSASYLLLTGMMLGLAMLIRPSGIALPIVFGLFAVIRQRGLPLRQGTFSAALVILGAAFTILPWEVHAWRVTGQLIPLSTGGVPTILDGLTYAVDPSESRPVRVPEGVRSLQWEIYEKSYQELDSMASIAGFLLERLRRTPGQVVQLFALKAGRAWYGTDSGVLDRWLLALQIPAVTFLLVATFRTWKYAGPVREAGILITMIMLYFWATTTLALSIVRYMVPALALMAISLPALGKQAREVETSESHSE